MQTEERKQNQISNKATKSREKFVEIFKNMREKKIEEAPEALYQRKKRPWVEG